MKVSLSWLKNYIPLETPAAELAEALTMAGLEVDSVRERYDYLDTVSVARIARVDPHPNAEKLRVCLIDTLKGGTAVVCGAPNVAPGMLVPWAAPGTELPNGTVIAENVIRGEASAGMLCSEAELGLGLDRSGIMALAADLEVGTPLAKALKLADAVIEIDLTPNRPDCLSILGIAREIAAIQGRRMTCPDTTLKDGAQSIDAQTSVTIEAPDHCPRYAARLVENVTIAPSPFWLQDRLLSVGLRPINNIVDITNFVLLEMGQPLHAFDFDRLAQHRIVVRTAEPGETFVTLDNKERSLDADMLMICDGEKPVAVAGVMGGLNSEIAPTTRRVLIESAYFNPRSIRKTSKKLGLVTDASFRFERGVDPEGVVAAVNRAAQMMVEIGGGHLVEGIVDEYPNRQRAVHLDLSVQRTNRLLGTRLERQAVAALLRTIDFDVAEGENEDALIVTPPSFRVDVTRPEDLMEEVARLYGYQKIETSFPAMPAEGTVPLPALQLRQRVKQAMSGLGFYETITYSFVHRESADRLRLPPGDPRRQALPILNPLTEDQAVMRTSLVPGMLATMAHNHSQGIRNLKLFETGKIFIAGPEGELPLEIESLIGLWSGARRPGSWQQKEVPCDFYDIKGIAEALLKMLKIDGVQFSATPPGQCGYTRPGRSAEIIAGAEPIGRVGEIHPQVLDNYALKQTGCLFEVRLDRLAELIPPKLLARPTPRFPAVMRDITIIVERRLEAQRVLNAVAAMDQPLVEAAWLFDVFEGQPIPPGKKSVSFRLTYRAADRTLSDEEVNALHGTIGAELIRTFKADLPA